MTATMLRASSSLACPPRFCTERNLSRPTFGPLVGQVAAALGKPLMPWQQFVADVALEVDDAGRLVYSEVVLTVPRQSGKTTLILPVFVHRSVAEYPGGNLDVGPQKQTVAYTAQTRNDARKKWIKEFIPLLEKSGFRHQFEKRLTNGSEGFDWLNKSTFDLVATMEKSGHGDTLDLGIIDEAFAQTDDRLEQAMEPATITRQSPQIWIVSTAGENEEKSPFLWSKVKAGRRACELGIESSSAYFEWSLGPDDDPDDIDVVAARHPAVGYTITKEALRQKQAKARLKDATAKEGEARDNLAGFKRAYCNIWGTVAVELPAKLPLVDWHTSARKGAKAGDGPLTVAYDVDLDGRSASIGVGANTVTRPYVELIDHREKVGWLADRLIELVERWEPIAVGYNAAGPALAQVGAILVAFREAGISPDLLVPLNASDYRAACQGFYTSVVEGALTRPQKQQPLDLAGEDASERPLAEGWVWHRRQATVPISPLVAVTAAAFLLPTEVEAVVDAAANVW